MSEAELLEAPLAETPEEETGDVDEPDEPDEQPEEAPEDEPEARTAPSTEKEIEKANKALDAEAKRHADRVGVIMGDDALDLVMCEACARNIPGFHWPATTFPEGSPERVLYDMLSGGADVLPVQPEFLRTCTACNGRGFWTTGSHAEPINQSLTCSNCGGKGYTDDRHDKPAPVVALAPTPDAPAPVAEPDPALDMLGRPPGHPNYGLLPIYMNAEQKARDEADGFTV